MPSRTYDSNCYYRWLAVGSRQSICGNLETQRCKIELRFWPAPKSITRTVVAQGDGAKYTMERVNANGTTSVYSFTANYDGRDHPVTGTGMPGAADSIAGKRINSHRVESVLKKNGKQVGTSVSEVSADGKTTTIKATGKNPDGSA